ncbi:DeoR/GlpR family DNA-binding transcription regulator [Curvivirga aplysinae]|uniref:DeoR/GlpR family DNA-binding transcription regulator n=1 Tax=Curvivirga aplysinae TaxID=2529852 RepID=UPI0012BD2652|nr:DeoR/GlpR family DNA-binding transcription regulator [Curvivirga aplysinae]MTI08825.1 DeoR/GlpR transcriptional regulator [Curvivirga aplysinae]
MHATKRETEILNTVRLKGSVTTMELAEMLGVTDQTIRRNVIPLVERGLVKKVHGAIVAPDRLLEAPFHRRMLENQDAKQNLATVVAATIADGDSIMLDAGSTTSYVAQALVDKKNLTVITNSAQIASTLAPNPTNKVYFAGSELRSDDSAAFDAQALKTFNQFDVQYAILSATALHAQRGIMVQKAHEAELSRMLISRASHVIVAADSTKFDRKSLISVCEFSDIQTLVSNEAPIGELAEALETNNVFVSTPNT